MIPFEYAMRKKKASKNKIVEKKKTPWSAWHYLLFAVVAVIVFFSLRGNYGLIRYLQLQKQKNDLVRQIHDLQQQQTELTQEIERLTNDYHYIESIVRERYKMGKKGEKIYFMILPKEASDNR